MALPMVAVGMTITLVLVQLQQSAAQAAEAANRQRHPIHSGEVSHPIVEEIARGDMGTLAIVFLLACVVAPIVEETMFRGVLYRHLREVSAWAGLTLSVLVSGLWVAFIFCRDSYPGLLAVPALMPLAFAFAVTRKWRGSLYPSSTFMV